MAARSTYATVGILGLGVLAVGVAVAGHRKRVTTWPPVLERIVRRHVSPDDLKMFWEAWQEHRKAGRPATRAAVLTLASIHLDPGALDRIKADLKAQGFGQAEWDRMVAKAASAAPP